MTNTTGVRPAELYIDGKWRTGNGEHVVTVGPATGSEVAQSPSADAGQVDAALRAARAAFDGGEWSRLGPTDRRTLLYRLADLMQENREELVRIAAIELGTPVSTAPTLHVDLPAKYFRWFGDAALRGPGEGYEQPMPLDHDPITTSGMLLRQPVGVVGAVVAYNVPVMMSAYKLGGALAAGCSAVLVTSPKSVLLTEAFVRLVDRAGFPRGAVNYVFGPPGTTSAVVGSPMVDMVTFTGSPAVGTKILQLAAPNLTKTVLELGGKSPNIVLPGADLAKVVGPSALRFTRNSGQACGATTRTFVPRTSLDEYVARSAEFLSTLTVGDPFDADTVLGPLSSAEHLSTVQGFLSRAESDGAAFAVGGSRPGGALAGGFYLEPTLVTGIGNGAEIAQEELFAPVGVVIPYDDVDDAILLANDVKYALNANIWGPTPTAIEFARRVRSGTVTINGGGGMRPDAPWGGPGASGIGREGGDEGFREFFEIKHIQWPL
jgi:aldehyde dehydrogenase (NAD+)/betaine-aldehyde dehydrogenase